MCGMRSGIRCFDHLGNFFDIYSDAVAGMDLAQGIGSLHCQRNPMCNLLLDIIHANRSLIGILLHSMDGAGNVLRGTRCALGRSV